MASLRVVARWLARASVLARAKDLGAEMTMQAPWYAVL